MFRRLLPALCLAFLLGACASDDSDPMPQPAADAGADPADAGELASFMEPCENDDQCETGLCFPYNAAGPHCTHACENDLDCEEPSPGCNGMGVCKRPH